jgi:hypothetical protein
MAVSRRITLGMRISACLVVMSMSGPVHLTYWYNRYQEPELQGSIEVSTDFYYVDPDSHWSTWLGGDYSAYDVYTYSQAASEAEQKTVEFVIDKVPDATTLAGATAGTVAGIAYGTATAGVSVEAAAAIGAGCGGLVGLLVGVAVGAA